MANVLIAENPGVVRDGLNYLIEKSGNYKVVGLIDTLEELLCKCCKLDFDVILIGFDLDLEDKSDIIITVKEKYNSKMLILASSFQNPVGKIVMSGVDGYILSDKHCDLELALNCLMAGMTVLHNDVYSRIIEEIRHPSDRVCSKNSIYRLLSPTEKEIITLVVAGKTNKQISEIIYISEGTVRNRLTAIYRKLDVKDRVGLAVNAINSGFTHLHNLL